MTARQRIMSIRLMEKMENAYQNNNHVIKEDGTMKYVDNNGNALFEAKMTMKGEA